MKDEEPKAILVLLEGIDKNPPRRILELIAPRSWRRKVVNRSQAPYSHFMIDRRAYWVTNIRYVTALLLVWFVVSFGFGILLVDQLNEVRLFGSGFKLGFWFAQQGSIYVFVLLILIYVRLMNRLDKRYGVFEGDDEDEEQADS